MNALNSNWVPVLFHNPSTPTVETLLADSADESVSRVIACNHATHISFFPIGTTNNTTATVYVQFAATRTGTYGPSTGTSISVAAHSGGVAQPQTPVVVEVNGAYCRLLVSSGSNFKMSYWRSNRR